MDGANEQWEKIKARYDEVKANRKRMEDAAMRARARMQFIIKTIDLIGYTVAILLSVGVVAATCYTIIHFVIKYW